jgi:hypothetical protein
MLPELRKSIVVVVLNCICFTASYAQLDSAEIEYRKAHRNYKAMQDIFEMKHGVLLVRLNTKYKTIEALERNERIDDAEYIRQKQQQWNKKVVSYFREHYNFTPVYFFFSTETEKVKRKEFEFVHFLDSTLQPLEIQPAVGANFWVGEVNYLDQNERTGSDMGFEAILLRDSEFKQLDHPFPFYSRTYRSVLPEKRMVDAMKLFNSQLHEFYERMQVKRPSIERREDKKRMKERKKLYSPKNSFQAK